MSCPSTALPTKPFPRKLLIASNNPHKLAEFREILAGFPLALTSPHEEHLAIWPPETGATFAENAILKATAFARASGLVALADDSGLEVEALAGEPGILSARYSGIQGDHAANIYRLLSRLEGVPMERRRARFHSVIAIATPAGQVHTCHGECTGYIAFEPRGSGGFGYDPVFFLPEFGMTMAELPSAVKNRVSHRGRAGQAARLVLQEIFDIGVQSEEA